MPRRSDRRPGPNPRYLRPGKVSEVSLIGVVLLLAIIGGGWVAETEWGADWFTLSKVTIAWLLIAYGVAAAVLPVWLLLAPRDYLSTFMSGHHPGADFRRRRRDR